MDELDKKVFEESEINSKYSTLYISQDSYKEKMVSEVEPYLKKILKSGYLLGKKDNKLYYEKFIVENPKANIVICHGFGEFTEKYYELIYYFNKAGYSVFIMEHRGHGRSNRLGIDKYQINIDKFSYYVEDLREFIDKIVIPNGKEKKLLLFAHSMGGAIGTLFLERYNQYFQGAVLSSPMFEINTGKIPKIIANIIARAMKLFFKERNYLPGQYPYHGKKEFPSKATSCIERYNYIWKKITEKNDFHIGGASALWYLESLKATKELIKKKNILKIKIPVILFQTEYDKYVNSKPQNKFAETALNCKLIKIKGSKHEAYFEKDEISFEFFNEVLNFYDNRI